MGLLSNAANTFCRCGLPARLRALSLGARGGAARECGERKSSRGVSLGVSWGRRKVLGCVCVCVVADARGCGDTDWWWRERGVNWLRRGEPGGGSSWSKWRGGGRCGGGAGMRPAWWWCIGWWALGWWPRGEMYGGGGAAGRM